MLPVGMSYLHAKGVMHGDLKVCIRVMRCAFSVAGPATERIDTMALIPCLHAWA